MNCATTQRQLLAAERPDRPDADLRAHLAACPACRALQRRLLQIERQLPNLPVPPSTARPAFVRHFLDEVSDSPTPPPVRLPLPLSAAGTRAKDRALKKLALAFALAAALLVFAIGWWAWPHHGPALPEVDHTAPHRLALEQQLKHARNPGDRVRAVAEVMEAVQREALDPASDAPKLAQLAHYYARVVREDLRAHARALPAEERALVLIAIAERLSKTESDAERQAAEPRAARRAASLHEIAHAAREGDRWLRDLARGKAV